MNQIVHGTIDSNLREKLSGDNNLTPQKAELACKAAEAAAAAHQEIWASEHKQVDPVGVAPSRKTFPPKEEPAISKCLKSGRRHAPRRCPAFGQMCRKCHRRNQFTICCKASTKVHELLGAEDNFDILDVSILGSSRRDWTVRVQVK